ncbi:MAG: PKD domain-containing [Planctomycetota bacterium]|nr:MAG: PKD domain-containing [Planctomycetota bacterium]
MKRMFGALLLAAVAAAEEPLEITADTTLDPAKTYASIVVKAGNITIDGKGAWVVGATAGAAKEYKGVGIRAKAVSGVKLVNVNVKGFETGLLVEDADGWTVEDCDFSNNFSDPDFGWGENGRRGGIVWTRVKKSAIRRCKANGNWDGCSLDTCDENTLEENDFSRASNTALKLWLSCRNEVKKNNFSWGLRISPGEVHARDSASLLIECGSNGNRFIGNDCTHGGDGIFVRVLNQWCSTDNLFEENDASFANNNAVECWAPRNTWVRNKANNSSYGFWMGGSDGNVLIENEAARNGLAKGFHNSPHLPQDGHAGIVFLFGPGSHTVCRGNRCHDNNGAGIAAIGDQESSGKKYKAFHWILEKNVLENNRWGIVLWHADWIDMAGNEFAKNADGDVKDFGNVSNVTTRKVNERVKEPPKAAIAPVGTARAGKSVSFDASGSRDPGGNPLSYRWDLGDGSTSEVAKPSHTYKSPGFYRVGLTVTNGVWADLAWVDLYVVEEIAEIGTEKNADGWTFTCETKTSKVAFRDDSEIKISGSASLFADVNPYGGFRLTLHSPRSPGVAVAGKKSVVFWLRARLAGSHGWQGENPVVTLHESEDKSVKLVPKGDYLSELKESEGREGWNYFEVPLAGDGKWTREGPADLKKVSWISLGFDTWDAPPLRIWLDGLGVR